MRYSMFSRDGEMVKYAVLILILVDVILNVTGQLSLKYGMYKIGKDMTTEIVIVAPK